MKNFQAGSPIGVGIIGAAPGRSWSAIAHIPALQSLSDYKLVALSTTRLETAQAAAKALGVPQAYGHHAALIANPEVDLVVVTVKVPHHLELVSAALDAGKMVYCEWPLGNGLQEAIAMAEHARRLGVRTICGTQARFSPAVDYVAELIRDGYVGEVLSSTLIGSGVQWGAFTDPANAYTADQKNGATLLSIPLGHALDALRHILGDFSEISATLAHRRNSILSLPDKIVHPLTAADQILVNALHQNGAATQILYRGGMSRGTNMMLEIVGTEGDLRLTGDFGHLQMCALALHGGRGDDTSLQPLTVPPKHRWAPDNLQGPAINVGQLYARFAADLRDGTHLTPDFDSAVQGHRILEAIERSADLGNRVKL
ncbi:Gfo/Idh/MocA family protein [Noviherbaspirillum sedimenti]|uniref:Gfo/Idh/MocA family oxidoreductase n=1 Tax=Noviherbaspirillum sedimenti TaxID=2320865 RepID=A0A3A3GQD7_9BURK|nr:Gfo/Idh/MocA family oxidoreductase [Noviherbaspirillum sedimenti]RJG03190.1 gfo/Idh/MocA family oxidoreductase [Noviherbaspirillum sedimenti]